MANQGANVLTATDANTAGTGTSNAVTYTLAAATAPTPPTLNIVNPNLTVSGGGGKIGLGLTVDAPASSTATTVTITGLRRFETITDTLDGKTFKGTSITLSAAEVNSGLTLTSNYTGSSHPVATLSITAKDTIGGVTSVSAAKTITVVDPPASAAGSSVAALAKQLLSAEPANEAGGRSFATNGSGAAHDSLALASSNLAAILANTTSAGALPTSSRYGGEHIGFAPDLAALSTAKIFASHG